MQEVGAGVKTGDKDGDYEEEIKKEKERREDYIKGTGRIRASQGTHHDDERLGSDALGPGGIAQSVKCLTDVGLGR